MYTLDNFQPNRAGMINWRMSKANIIYIPMQGSNIVDFFMQENLKPIYHNIIVPTGITFKGRIIRNAKYIAELRKKIQSVKFTNTLQNAIQKPVIYDLTQIIDTASKFTKSLSTLKVFDEFFEIVHKVYSTIKMHPQVGSYPVVVVFDNSHNSINDIELLVRYFRLKSFELPFQITDKYAFIYFKEIGYFPIATPENILKRNVLRLVKYTETLRKTDLIDNDNNPLTSEDDQLEKNVDVPREAIEKFLLDIYKKELPQERIDLVYSIVKTYVKSHPGLVVNWNSPEEAKRIIEEALKYSNKITGTTRKLDIKELIQMTERTHVFQKEESEKELESNITPIGVKTSTIANMKYMLDPKRTKYEFDINLDKVIEKMIRSLNDEKFGLTVRGIEREVVDDSANRYVMYKIKLKPAKGRAYTVVLRIPTLVHDTYFKINGEYYVINNQLMQKPIIKKSDNVVQLKTNYSVISYILQSASVSNQKYSEVVQKFMNDMKVAKKLKKAELIDKNTEERLKQFGIDDKTLSDLMYKKVEINV